MGAVNPRILQLSDTAAGPDTTHGTPYTLMLSSRSLTRLKHRRTILFVFGLTAALLPAPVPSQPESQGGPPPSERSDLLDAGPMDRDTALRTYLTALEVKNRDFALEKALERLEEINGRCDPHLAVSALSRLEDLDTRLRLDRLDQVDTELGLLKSEWSTVPSIVRRTRALRTLVVVKNSLFVEPNAVTRVSSGRLFEHRLLLGNSDGDEDGRRRQIPLNFPVRFLSQLMLESKDGAKKHPTLIAAFVELADLVDRSRGFFDRLEKLEKWTERSDILVAFFVYTGGVPAPEWDMEGRPWNRTVVFWFRGTFHRLEGLQVRTLYEWLLGPTVSRVAPGGLLADWCFPWDNWAAFEARVPSTPDSE